MILLRMTDRRENMQLRKYTPSDCVELTELFYNTVHKVNAKDYTKEQLDVWADGKADMRMRINGTNPFRRIILSLQWKTI